ncbi:MAG: magnesium transporter MgtE [Gemmatales bacterium]|nr:MAG: magnesium transporter MgtE [Gemmatales bacterium]
MLRQNDADGMKSSLESLHPATIAETLEEWSVDEIWKFLSHTDIRTQAEIFAYFPDDLQVALVEGAGRQHMAHLIEQMSHDDRVDLLQRLPPRVGEAILRLVDEADRRDIAALYRYGENTAGGIMTTEYAWLPENLTVGEALDRLRLQAPDSEIINYVYILDDQRRLRGVVSLRNLILARRDVPVRDIMETNVVSVHVGDDREIVARKIADYDLLAIPVVNDEGRLVGIVTHDDVIDVIVEEATEDVHRLGAVGHIEDEYLNAPFTSVWRTRAFWLACLFFAQLLTFGTMAIYQSVVPEPLMVVLALFIPMCISVGGNSGSQAVTLITRALALGEVELKDWFRVLWHEVKMGLALGLTVGAIGFVFAYLTPASVLHGIPRFELSISIACAVMFICFWGTMIGAMLPLGFKLVGIDPAIASSPAVATLVDFTGVIIFFSIAVVILS